MRYPLVQRPMKMKTDPLPDVESLLADSETADRQWTQVSEWAASRYRREASVESLLFLIGIHARGGDFEVRLKKEAKQDLIMDGTCAALETIGIYQRDGAGWRRIRTLPVLPQEDQERLLRIAIARYLLNTIGSSSP